MRDSKFNQQNRRFFLTNPEAEWFGGYWRPFLKQFTAQNNFWQLCDLAFLLDIQDLSSSEGVTNRFMKT